jgi:CRISPR/Cas system CSM-associated protein Csm3 (group 7 of RAMP superfamily)
LDFSGSFADEAIWRSGSASLPLGPFSRDHARIDLRTGAVVMGGKFDEEYAPVGLRFALEMRLDGWSGEPPEASVDLFLRLGHSVQNGDLLLGGKKTSGFGRFKTLAAQGRRFDLKQEKGALDWLNLSAGPLFLPEEGEEILFKEPPTIARQGLSGSLTVPMLALGPLLVSGSPAPIQNAPDFPEEADLVFYKEPFYNYDQKKIEWEDVVPSSSIRGALRHRIYQIAEALISTERAQELIDSMFGQIDQSDPKQNKFFFEDIRLPSKKEVMVPHVSIDRFSGGVLNSALFFEAPLWDEGLKFQARVHFENLTDLEAAIATRAFFDLLEGQLPIGGGVNRGNGYIGLEGGFGSSAFKNISGEIRWGEETLSSERPGLASAWLARLERILVA